MLIKGYFNCHVCVKVLILGICKIGKNAKNDQKVQKQPKTAF